MASGNLDQVINRRNFLCGKNLKANPIAIRPPGSQHDGFPHACNGCGECVTACPTKIVQIGGDQLPEIDFSRGECLFCGRCITACSEEALLPDLQAPWPWVAVVSETCLSMNGITCRTCQDNCGENAIYFRLQLGGRAEPIVDLETCTGCGACISTCPSRSISIERRNPPTESVQI